MTIEIKNFTESEAHEVLQWASESGQLEIQTEVILSAYVTARRKLLKDIQEGLKCRIDHLIESAKVPDMQESHYFELSKRQDEVANILEVIAEAYG